MGAFGHPACTQPLPEPSAAMLAGSPAGWQPQGTRTRGSHKGSGHPPNRPKRRGEGQVRQAQQAGKDEICGLMGHA